MTTIELIELLERLKCGGATRKPRKISFMINEEYIHEPSIEVVSTGDGVLGADITLEIHDKEDMLNIRENVRMILNEIKVIDFDISGEEVDYILVGGSLENKAILNTIVRLFQLDFEIKEDEEGNIDISQIGFQFSDWWDSSEGFIKEAIE